MANTKISDLTAAGTLTGAEQVPIVQSGTTKRTTITELVQAGGLFVATWTWLTVSGSYSTLDWADSTVDVTVDRGGLVAAATGDAPVISGGRIVRMDMEAKINGTSGTFFIEVYPDPSGSPDITDMATVPSQYAKGFDIGALAVDATLAVDVEHTVGGTKIVTLKLAVTEL